MNQTSVFRALTARLKALFDYWKVETDAHETLRRAEDALDVAHKRVVEQEARVQMMKTEGRPTAGAEEVLEMLKENETEQKLKVDTLKRA